MTLLLTGAGPSGAGGAFNPLTLSPAGWWKATSLDGLGDGVAIGSWADSSGNGRAATQATAGLKPLKQTVVNGGQTFSVARSDGVDDILTTASFAVAQAFTLYAVVSGGGNRYFSAAGDGVRAGWDSTPQANNFAGATLLGNRVAPVASAAVKVITSVFNGVSSLIRINGVQVVAGDAGAGAIATGINLMASTGQLGTGDVAEVFLQPGAAVSAAMENYLGAQCGVTMG